MTLFRRFSLSSLEKLYKMNSLYLNYMNKNENISFESLNIFFTELYAHLNIWKRHYQIFFYINLIDNQSYVYYPFLYGLELIDTAYIRTFYKIYEIYKMLFESIQSHIIIQQIMNTRRVNFIYKNALKTLEISIFICLYILHNMILLNPSRKNLFIIVLYGNMNIQLFSWFCSTEHKKEMNALLIFLNDLFENNSHILEGFEINDSQLAFLKFLNTFLSNYNNQKIIISQKLCEFIELFLNHFSLLMIEILKTQTSNDDGIIKRNKKILKTTEILISCAFYISKNAETKQLLLKNDLLKNMIDLLRFLNNYTISSKKNSNTRNKNDGEFKYPYFKRDIIQLLSTLCFRDKKVQDNIRELHGLNLILSQCNIDDENPYIKEYAIFCLRNLLENNEENKKLLREMKAIQLQDSEIVNRLGLTIGITNERHKKAS
ncbi:hypothetical protein PCK1_000656 [Pneumocystis canis]|nr:hypothetical protein PCK1_000656 [Pneumocystis canis]